MTFVVIENTPGFLPEDDDPPTFESYVDAVAYLNDRAKEYEEMENADFEVEYGLASCDNLAAVMVHDHSKKYDLGRSIAIVNMEVES